MHVKEWVLVASVCTLLTLVSGCLGMLENRGDKWAAKLRVGMAKSEVETVINVAHTAGTIKASDHDRLFDWGMEVVPYDLSKKVAEGTEVWGYDYWISSNTVFHLNVFFTVDGRVMGWVKPHSAASTDKYKHERLTSQLRKEMKDSGVRKLLGSPQSMTPISVKSVA